jgi:hypothetical protein
MQVSPILRKTVTGHAHWCPACEQVHILPDSWKFNGDVDKPTFSPSFKHTLVARAPLHGPDNFRICHYILTDGKIQFCPDSWHKRSDIVSMPLLPSPHEDDGFPIETQD